MKKRLLVIYLISVKKGFICMSKKLIFIMVLLFFISCQKDDKTFKINNKSKKVQIDTTFVNMPNTSSAMSKEISDYSFEDKLYILPNDVIWYFFIYDNKKYYLSVNVRDRFNSNSKNTCFLNFFIDENKLLLETIPDNNTNLDTELKLYNSSLKEIASDNNSGELNMSKIMYVLKEFEEPNDTFSKAFSIPQKENYILTAKISPKDKDYFSYTFGGEEYYVKISAINSGAYIFELERYEKDNKIIITTFPYNDLEVDTKIEVYNRQKYLLYSDDNSGENHFSYLSINKLVDKAEPNNSFNKAYLINNINEFDFDANISPRDKDFFKFFYDERLYYILVSTNKSKGNYSLSCKMNFDKIILETKSYEGSNINTELSLYDKNQKLIASNNNGGENHFSKIEKILLLDLCEPNNNFSQSYKISTNQFNTTAKISNEDKDFFSFNYNKNKYYFSISSNKEGFYLLNFSLDNNILTISTDSYEDKFDGILKINLYDKNRKLISQNNFSCSMIIDGCEPNNNFAQAFFIQNDNFKMDLNISKNDEDYFKINYLGKPYYFVISGEEGNYSLDYQKSNNEVNIETFPYHGNKLQNKISFYNFAKEKIAYAASQGADKFSNLTIYLDDTEPNDNFATAYLIRENDFSINSNIGSKDKDFYKFVHDNKSYYLCLEKLISGDAENYRLDFLLQNNKLQVNIFSLSYQNAGIKMFLYDEKEKVLFSSVDVNSSLDIYLNDNNNFSNAYQIKEEVNFEKRFSLGKETRNYYAFNNKDKKYYFSIEKLIKNIYGNYKLNFDLQENFLNIKLSENENNQFNIVVYDDAKKEVYKARNYLNLYLDEAEPNDYFVNAYQINLDNGFFEKTFSLTKNDLDYFKLYYQNTLFYLSVSLGEFSAYGNYILRIDVIDNSIVFETLPYEHNDRNENMNTQIILYDENQDLIDKDFNSGEKNFSKLELIM